MNRAIFEFDKAQKEGCKYILGVDEAGRGPGAGDVFAACVCFKMQDRFDLICGILPKLNDSKKLSEKTREELFPVIKENALFSINSAGIEEIEKLNILNAALLAMEKSVFEVAKKLDTENILVLVDGNKKIKNLPYPQKTIIKGDFKSASVAAASILAKVARDNYMLQLDNLYPEYNFKKNKGYLTKEHIDAIKKFGICEVHRKSFLTKIL